jgi:hypothetical protein
MLLKPFPKKGEKMWLPEKFETKDSVNPTHQGVHIIQDNNLPKKFGLLISAYSLKLSNILPNTIMFDIP